MTTTTRTVFQILIAAVLLAGCGTPVVNPVSGRSERSVMDEAAEMAEGQKAHPQVMAEYGALDNPRLQAYVNDIGQRLAQRSHRALLKWTFTVLDSAEVNAFALPGGYIYVTRGMLATLNDEADLAGVLGHEIGHVTARHGAQRATREQRAGLGVFAATLLGVALEGFGVSGAAGLASQVSQGVAASYVATYSREQESQADKLGAEYLARNNLNPRNMIDVIGALKAQERYAADSARAEGRRVPEGGGNYLASHPSNDKRLADITQIAAAYVGSNVGGYADDGRARYLQAIDGITFGESRAQGVTRGRHFYHEDLGLAISAPAGWSIDNGAQALAIVNPAGDAGLVMKPVPAQAGRSHDEVIRNALKPSEGRSERRSLNGLAATHFSGSRRDAQGRAVPIEVTLVTGPTNQFYLLQTVARDAAAARRAEAGLREAEGSLRALSASERAAARPWALKMVALPRGGFAELARGSPLPAPAEAQLRLINGVYAGQGAEPKVGQWVKVVL